MKFGKLLSWHTNRGFGILQGPTSHAERYFLHISKIDEPLDFVPEVGINFQFDVVPSSKEGELARAINAKAVAAPAVAEVR
jgi:hypothetical protein